MAHQDPPMLARLVDALRKYPVVVHLDAKANRNDFPAFIAPHFVSDDRRIDVRWGGFSEVRAVKSLYETVGERFGADGRRHVVLLSGSDYPVRPLEEFESFLRNSKFQQHLPAYKVLDGTRYMERRVRSQHFFDRLPVGHPSAPVRKGRAVARRALSAILPRTAYRELAEWNLGWSSTWTVLTLECIEDCLQRASKSGFDRLASRFQTPLEMYFPTLVYSSCWAKQTESGALGWRAGRRTGDIANVHYIDRSLSRWLNDSDAASIVNSNKFFARKIRYDDLDSLLQAVSARRSIPNHSANGDFS